MFGLIDTSFRMLSVGGNDWVRGKLCLGNNESRKNVISRVKITLITRGEIGLKIAQIKFLESYSFHRSSATRKGKIHSKTIFYILFNLRDLAYFVF